MHLKVLVDGHVLHFSVVKETKCYYFTKEAYSFGIYSTNYKLRQNKLVKWHKDSRKLLAGFREDVLFGKPTSYLPEDYDGLVY